MSLPIINFFGGTAGALMPFMCAPVFKKGDVPAGAKIVASIPNFQAEIKSTWPDGSAKSALIGGRCAISAGIMTAVQLSIGTPTAGTNLSTTDIKNASLVVAVDCGSFGAVSWSGTDWDTPFERWTEGPQMANYRYRKPVGTDSHLVVWCEVTVWPGVAPRVLAWFENGYTKKAGPTNKVVTYALTINGTQREGGTYDIKHHMRPVISSGSKTHHWGGSTDLSVMVRHDPDYLVASRILPPYMSSVRGPAFDDNNKFSSTSSSHRALVSTYQPGDVGNFTYDEDNMANTGYQCSIGLLPTHDAAYLICNTQPDLLYKAVVFNGYAIGRYSIFRRDENTNLPPSIVTHQTLVLHDSPNGENVTATGQSENGNTTPAVTGSAAAGWDVAHSPRAGLLAHIVTGEKFHLETTQAVFTTNWLSISSYNQRAGVRARFTTDYGAVQTRQIAWGMNSLANAATIMPDADPMKAEYIAEIEKHINYFHATYAVGGNQFGLIEPGEEYGDIVAGHQAGSPWQQDFVTGAYGHLVAQDLHYSNSGTKAKLAAFFAWKARTIIGRLNGYGGYTWENFAAFYRLSWGTQVLPNFYPNNTGFLASWALVYTESASPNYTWASPGPGIIGTEFGDSLAAQSMLGNAQPGLAYAVEENVPGAAAAYSRMISASNWAANVAGFKNSPVWAMEPVNIQTSSGGGTLTTPGPSFTWDSASLIPNSFIWDAYRGLGIPLSAVPSGGTNGTSVIRALIESGDNPNSEARVRYISTPTGFASGGDTSYTSPAGAINYEAYLDGASLGTATDTVGSGSGSTVTSVVVSPSTATGSTTFTAVVNGIGSPSQAVTWTRSGSAGSINATTGVFTAPAATSSVQTITITATSTQDGGYSGIATVSIAAIGSTVTGVVVTPSSGTLFGGATRQHSATVNGANGPSQAVTWTTDIGSISVSGLLTAPAATSVQQNGTVSARSQQDNNYVGTATFVVPASGTVQPTVNYGRKNIKPSKFKITRFR